MVKKYKNHGTIPVSRANAVALLPRSTGWVTINSTDPFEQALFYPNFFSHPEDMKIIKEGLLNLRKIFDSDVREPPFLFFELFYYFR